MVKHILNKLNHLAQGKIVIQSKMPEIDSSFGLSYFLMVYLT